MDASSRSCNAVVHCRRSSGYLGAERASYALKRVLFGWHSLTCPEALEGLEETGVALVTVSSNVNAARKKVP